MMDLRFDCDVPPTVHHGDTVLHLDDGEATGPLFLTQNTDFRCREVCKLGDLTAFELRAVLILEQMSVLIEVQAARFKDRERQHQPSSFKYGGWVAECHDMVDAKKKKKDEKMESIRRDVEAFLDGIEDPPPPAVEPITYGVDRKDIIISEKKRKAMSDLVLYTNEAKAQKRKEFLASVTNKKAKAAAKRKTKAKQDKQDVEAGCRGNQRDSRRRSHNSARISRRSWRRKLRRSRIYVIRGNGSKRCSDLHSNRGVLRRRPRGFESAHMQNKIPDKRNKNTEENCRQN